MPNESNANEFYQTIVQGRDQKREISLEHSNNLVLEHVMMRPVDKQTLASCIERLPEEMFEAVDEAQDADEAEEAVEESDEISLNAVTEETVNAFEDLVKESISHDELTDHQMNEIVKNLDFEMLFELGAQIIEMSFEQNGAIKDFHEQG